MKLEALRFWYLRRVVATALGMGSAEFVDRLARRIGRGVFQLNTPKQQSAIRRAADWLGADPNSADARRLIREMYEHYGRFWAEVLFAKRRLRRKTTRQMVTIEEEDSLRHLTSSRRGRLIASAYFGNVGVAAWALGEVFRPLHVVVDTFSHPMLRVWQREAFADPLVCVIDRREASRRVPEALEAGGAVMLIADTPRSRGRAVQAAFLGRDVRCYPTLGVLSRGLHVPVAVVTCRREARPMEWTLRCHGLIDPSDCREDKEVVQRTMSLLERGIAQHPEQYDWTTPTGVSGVWKLDGSGSPEEVEKSRPGKGGERRTECGQIRRGELCPGPGSDAHDHEGSHECDVSPRTTAIGGRCRSFLVHQPE